jgi:hypothetical protein
VVGGFVAAFLLLSWPAAVRAAEVRADPAAQALLQKHRDYVGWQFGDGTFRSMRISGSVADDKGKKIHDVTAAFLGPAFRETVTRLDQDGTTADRGFTGSIFWQSFTSGFTIPIYGEAAKSMAAYTMLLLEGTSGLNGLSKGPRTMDGKSVQLVRVSMEHVDPIDLYIDPGTGAYVAATIDPDGASEETYHIVSYADVMPGKKAIGSYRIGDSKHLYTNEHFEPNAEITPEELHPPKTTASWSFASTEPVPIRLTHDRILVDATVNGMKGTFILDTGSDAIRLDDKFADRAGVRVLKGSSKAYSIYDEVNERLRSVDKIDFGNASLQNALVYSEDFERFGYKGLDEQGYAGLMGFDFFAGAIVKLDIYASKMTILDPSSFDATVPGIPIFTDLSDGELTVPMKLDNAIDINALLDSGNPGEILFSYALVKKHLPFNPRTMALGPIQYTVGSWDSCCFGANYALLGYDFLRHFDLILDYPHGRIFMVPNKN